MELIQDKLSIVILLGGKSSRMNYNDKANLIFNNKYTFIQQIKSILPNINIYYSLKNDSKQEIDKLNTLSYTYDQLIFDTFDNIGPIDAIYSSMKKIKSKYILFISNDIPFISNELIHYTISHLFIYNKSIIIKSVNGIEPLFSIYENNYNIIENKIIKKNYRLKNIINDFEYYELKITNTIFNNELININTVDEYTKYITNKNNINDKSKVIKTFQPSNDIKIFCVSGFKNSGKTTLIKKLIPLFLKDKYKIAILKHDGHTFTDDIINTDTSYFLQKGAKDVTIYNKHKYKSIIYDDFNLEKYIKEKIIRDYDFIIIEGMKDSKFKKIQMESNNNENKSITFKNTFIKVKKNKYNIKYVYEEIIKEFNERSI